MKRILLITALSLSCASLLWGCGKKSTSKTDLASTHTTVSKESMASTTAGTEASDKSSASDESTKETASETTKAGEVVIPDVAASIKTHKEGKVTIEYPVVSNLSKPDVQEKINKLLENHALEFISAYEVNTTKDSLNVKCKVISIDRRRITTVYTGTFHPENAAYPTNIFYTNTIDTVNGKDMGLTDYADPYTLAGYILSDDCEFDTRDQELKKELMTIRSQTSIDDYTNMFKQADFPYKTDGSEESIAFPQVFSYEDQGTVFVAIPVPHALGDYALVKYTPEGK